MRLSLQTDYALRTLMYLATVDGRATVTEVAQFFGVSRAHIAKVVRRLGQLSYIRNLRGVGGGIEFTRRPEEISIGEVILAFEGSMRLLECVDTDNVCVVESFCRLRGALAEAERLQIEYLKGVSLRDVLPTRKQLHRVASQP